ncbi:hypothetical protein TSUD_24660 [Trifolium subterraneum]|uniref:Uncharacterized protein n=1 Tax=Trifolium subterraneum TaxID=3900 RepID=A0A2Z6NRF2_TRISU|nr:hypothetical protein TSUD_24660 [Trifolium subterraneum]
MGEAKEIGLSRERRRKVLRRVDERERFGSRMVDKKGEIWDNLIWDISDLDPDPLLQSSLQHSRLQRYPPLDQSNGY